MKNTKIYVMLFTLALHGYLLAQAPQKFNYQGIARSTTGAALANQLISVKISITEGLAGTVLYMEIHGAKTNNFGLYTLTIGGGTLVTGDFASINWASGNKYVTLYIDPLGGNNYLEMGSTPLLSVPYANHADKASQTMLYNNASNNANKMAIQHSPTLPNYGLQFEDSTKRMKYLSNGANLFEIDLGKAGVRVKAPFAVMDGSQGAKKVLTSDAFGNARWNSPDSVATKIMMYKSGSFNTSKMLVQHSPGYPDWGLQYNDSLDIFRFMRGTYSSLDIGYTVSVNKRFAIKDGSQGANKVLVSDNEGNASWQNTSTRFSSAKILRLSKEKVGTTMVKIGDILTFEKLNANTVIELLFQGGAYGGYNDFGGLPLFEIRVDDLPTTIGEANQYIYGTGTTPSIIGYFPNLNAGMHTVSIWCSVSFYTAQFPNGLDMSVGGSVIIAKEYR